LLQLKRYSIEKCLKYLSEEDAGILCAALLGEKSYLDTHLKELYQENGIAHILAISGLHISIIGGSLYHLLRKLGLPFFPAGMMSFLIMIPYCLMIGNGVAAVRAVVMLIIFIGADIKGRHYDFLTSASIAGTLILYESPYYLFDAGFLLSFGAVFAIGCVYPCFEKIKYGQPLWLGISIWLVLLPIQLWFFYEISIASIFLNFVVVPLMPVVVSFGLIGILTPFIFSFSICHWILRLYQWLLVFPAVVIGQPGWYFIVLYAVLLIVGCYFIRNRNHYLSIACIFAGIFALYLALMHGFFVTFLDVGQGDCIVVHSLAGHTYMIDGGSSDISKVGTYRIVPYLKSQGIRALDYVIVTHFDEDHYSGIQEMIESGYPMKNLIVFQNIDTEDEGYKIIAELAKRQGISILRFSREDQLQEGELSLTCLFPNKVYTAEKNQESLVFLLKYKEFDCLLTGDLEKQGEEDLCKYDLPEVEILKVGHHGSKNASSEELLSKINPLYAVISCGLNNRYGHPHADTINRLKNQGSNILVTAECGAVMVKEKRGIIRMEGYLLK
jgi:competence protein ComEC